MTKVKLKTRTLVCGRVRRRSVGRVGQLAKSPFFILSITDTSPISTTK